MNIYLEAFGIFFKIGAFTIGGGYAMVPLIENEIVTKRNWISKDDFIDLLAIAQSAGHSCRKHFDLYRIQATRHTGKPCHRSWDGTSVIRHHIGHCHVFHNFKDNPIVERIFKGIRPAVVALIAAPTFSMAKSAKVNRYTLWIPVISALLIWLLGFSPIWIIIAAGVGGFCWGKWKQSHP